MLCGVAQTASAYAEDVCYLPNGGGIANCTPLPDECKPAGTVSPVCRTAALQVFAAQGTTFPNGGRSTVHVDATYLLAQAVGFPSTNAYWIAAYNEATDLGSFQARDLSASPSRGTGPRPPWMAWSGRTSIPAASSSTSMLLAMEACPTLPPPWMAFTRMSATPTRRSSSPMCGRGRCGTTPVPQCTAGLTVPSAQGDYATGNTCFALPGGSAGVVDANLAALGNVTQDFSLFTGLQTIVTSAQTGGPKTSESFDEVVGGGARALDARLGVYLHALGDRVSHHVCTDRSVLAGPDASGTFTEYMDNNDCVQPLHAIRHMWEVGVDFDLLSSADRTTERGLEAIYDELVAFANARGTLDPRATDAAYRQELLDRVTAALSIEDAEARVRSLAQIACDKGLQPLPGMPACASNPIMPAQAGKPDILLLLVDDLDLPAFEVMLATTDPTLFPHIKALVAEGKRFDNYFTTDSICCPSRATYLTGQYPHNHGALDVTTGHGYWENTEHDNHTLATWMQSAGYHTGLIGKYLNGYGDGEAGEGLPSYVPPGWTQWFALYGANTYNMYQNSISDNGVTLTTSDAPSDYQTDVLSVRAQGFVSQAPAGSPLFLFLTPTAPHTEALPAYAVGTALRGYAASYQWTLRPAPRHENLAVPALPSKSSRNEEDVTDKPAWLQAIPEMAVGDLNGVADYWRDKLRAMQAVDEMLGNAMAALEARGTNHYVVFTSDNGYFHGEHRLTQKGCAYEEAIRLPLVIKGPGIAAGSVSSALVVNNDLAPTLADLADMTPDITVDGRSFAALLTGTNTAWARKRFFEEHYQEDTSVPAINAVPPFRALRTLTSGQNEVFVEWYENGLGAPATAYERYDVAADPLQLTSTHGSVPPGRARTPSKRRCKRSPHAPAAAAPRWRTSRSRPATREVTTAGPALGPRLHGSGTRP